MLINSRYEKHLDGVIVEIIMRNGKKHGFLLTKYHSEVSGIDEFETMFGDGFALELYNMLGEHLKQRRMI